MSSPTCHGYGAVASGGKRGSVAPTTGQVILPRSAGCCQRATLNLDDLVVLDVGEPQAAGAGQEHIQHRPAQAEATRLVWETARSPSASVGPPQASAPRGLRSGSVDADA